MILSLEQIDYDFSKIDKNILPAVTLLFVARAKHFDDKIKVSISERRAL